MTRRPTREVCIGDVVVGGRRPVAVQSMTTTRTADASATAAQVAALARAGCAIVRVTTPSRADAEALPEIRRLLAADGVKVPLVADIHFTPHLALQVVPHVEKVRINPGNFADRRSISGEPYDDRRWDADVERMYGLFAPVVDRARELGVALRIGVNHGSLADRLVQRYGDTPEGMVQSALEFVRICEDRGHRDVVISMKASHTQVMVRAYRLLVQRLSEAGLDAYPLHLGVTEAGGGDEGRMKSAAGIGSLLADGLGDTVRVSLTEDPLAEVPVAHEIVRLFAVDAGVGAEQDSPVELVERRDPLDPVRRPAAVVTIGGVAYGGDAVPRVEVVLPPADGRLVAAALAARPPVELIDVVVEASENLAGALATLHQVPPGGPARGLTITRAARAVLDRREFRAVWGSLIDRATILVDPAADDPARLLPRFDGGPVLLALEADAPLSSAAAAVVEFVRAAAGLAPNVLFGFAPGPGFDVIGGHRLLAAALDSAGVRAPIVLADRPAPADEDPRLGACGRLASLLLDGVGDAVRAPGGAGPAAVIAFLHGVLQSSRRRLERAEYIACPSCGRTLFDLEETTARIRALTGHLKLKIGVMGCVVNGPGEMADADFGYVGWGEGKVALFEGREMVAKDIPSAEAPARLVELIKKRGAWVDPPQPLC